jgi:exopolyphosphatase/pppGpp-phosphohydrolase
MVEPTSVISFRINEKTKQSLEDECELRNVSVNSALNRMVDNHLKWENFAEEIGLIFVTKAIFRELLAKMEESEIKILATTICRSALKNAAVYMKGEFNYGNLLEVIDMWLSHSKFP